MASSSFVIQQLIPTLAGQLARLRRTPGRSQAWVEHALKALERSDPSRFERTRRRIGFGRRLGEMAALDKKEQAAVTLALFFHELTDGHGRGKGATAEAWVAYLLRNEDWLWPAYQVCEEIAPGWQASESKPTIVANVTVAFDGKTIERHERTLHVIQQLMAEAESEQADEIVPLLWSEQGQELCDYHFRRRPGSYKLAATDLQACLQTLHAGAPAIAAGDEAVAAFQLSGAAQGRTRRKERQLPEEETAMPSREQPEYDEKAAANFDRRREELRARSAFGLQDFSAPGKAERNGRRQQPLEPSDEEPSAVIIEPPTIERPTTKIGMPADYEDGGNANEAARPVRREEDTVEPRTIEPSRVVEQSRQVASVPPGRGEALDMMQKLQDVRLQLGQIQRIAIDAEQLLTGLAPQLDELASWISELDAIVGRWRGTAGGRIERAA
jgi:hypothetical protein